MKALYYIVLTHLETRLQLPYMHRAHPLDIQVYGGLFSE